MTLYFVVLLLSFVLVVAAGYLVKAGIHHAERINVVRDQMDRLTLQLNQINSDSQQKTGHLFDRLQDKMETHIKSTSEYMKGSHEWVQQRLDVSSRVFSELSEKLGRLEQSSKQIQNLGEDIAELHHLFKAPKIRGSLGELGLEQILSQLLPNAHYTMQYTFRSGDIVDAVIKLRHDQLVPIDSKFPYENFKKMFSSQDNKDQLAIHKRAFFKDVKNHIDVIARKYIRPEEGTLDFALLYFPAETLFYETIIKDELLGDDTSLHQYALSRKVVPVSPNSLYAYLQAIVMGLRGLQIEAQAHTILNQINGLKTSFKAFEHDYSLLEKHLGNAQNAYARSHDRLQKATRQLDELITAADITPPVIDVPIGQLSPETEQT